MFMPNIAEKNRSQRHEVRNVLNALLAAAEVIKVLPPQDPRLQQAREVIERQTHALAHLLEEIWREEERVTPALAATPPNEWTHAVPAPAHPKFMRGVLLLEMEASRHARLSAALRQYGHTVAHGGIDAAGLALLMQQRPEAVLIDVDAPLKSGLQLARQSRAAGYAGKLIACAGPQTELVPLEAMRHGFDEVLPYAAHVEQVRTLLKLRD